MKNEGSVVTKVNTLESFDWESIINDNKVLKYRKTNNNLSGKQNQLLAMYEGKYNILDKVIPGTIINGVIKSLSKRDMVIDINYKDDVVVEHKVSEGIIVSEYKVGDSIDVLIKEVNERPFNIKGSVIDLIKSKVEGKIVDFFNNNQEVMATVVEIIPAGFMLSVEIDKIKIPAFMPNTLADVNKISNPNVLLNKQIVVMFETLEQDKGIYVVSRKKYLKTLIPEKLKSLRFDKVYEGVVTGTTPFGVFVQFETCLTGMVHKANINEAYREKLLDIKAGTLIDFYVKEVTNSKKIILTQILRESLWDDIKVNDILSGEVLSVKTFGALIRLDYETAGLIPTNILNKSGKTLKVGEKLDVKIVDIHKSDKKIVLDFSTK